MQQQSPTTPEGNTMATAPNSAQPASPAPVSVPGPAPAPAAPPATALAPVPAAPAASRQSVLGLGVVVVLLAIAGLFYAVVDRPGLREPLDAMGSFLGGLGPLVIFLGGAFFMRRS
ncbi:hypothetical protein GCM10020227_22690 [Streptomyces flavovirens]